MTAAVDSLHDDGRLVVETIQAAGSLALSSFGKTIRSWDKVPGHPVTEADLAVNALIRDSLCNARQDYGWLSEESVDDPTRLTCRRVWVVDPIDGTRAYMRGDPDFAVSIALVEKGQPVIGAICQPVTNRLYLAISGQGASLNGRPIRLAARSALAGCRIQADESFFRSTRHWPESWPAMQYDKVSSVALRLARVAGGESDAMVFVRPKNDWDTAAGDLIVTEAGGHCCDETGRRPLYNRPSPVQPCLAAAAPALMPEILERIAPAMTLYRARIANQK